MPSCAIVTCNHRSESVNLANNGISFHRFPCNPEIKEKWIRATGRGPVWWPLKRSTICSVHFKENEFRSLPKSRRLYDWAVPTQKLPHIPTSCNPVFLNPGPSAPKRKCDSSHKERLSNSGNQVDDDSTLDDDNDGTQRPHHHDSHILDGTHDRNELPLHEDCRCQVCHNEIIGFRYTCVQCTHWDMCASCEARGEHPAHYVLRLPAPKPPAETEAVLAAIRKNIEDLLKLNNEIHEIIIKEEVIDEVKVEMDTTELAQEMNDSWCVPEVKHAHHASPTVDTPAGLTTHTASHFERDEVNKAVKVEVDMDTNEPTLEMNNRSVPEVKHAHLASSIADTPVSTRTAVPTTHTASHSEREEVNEAVKVEMDTTEPTPDINDRFVPEVKQAYHASSMVNTPASHTAVPTTHTASHSERDEVNEAVRILQTIKKERTDDPLNDDKTLSKNNDDDFC